MNKVRHIRIVGRENKITHQAYIMIHFLKLRDNAATYECFFNQTFTKQTHAIKKKILRK